MSARPFDVGSDPDPPDSLGGIGRKVEVVMSMGCSLHHSSPDASKGDEDLSW
jgi:hypothetical protein